MAHVDEGLEAPQVARSTAGDMTLDIHTQITV